MESHSPTLHTHTQVPALRTCEPLVDPRRVDGAHEDTGREQETGDLAVGERLQKREREGGDGLEEGERLRREVERAKRKGIDRDGRER